MTIHMKDLKMPKEYHQRARLCTGVLNFNYYHKMTVIIERFFENEKEIYVDHQFCLKRK